MSDIIRESLSALMDGEASELELRRILSADQNEIRQDWAELHRGQDLLKGNDQRFAGWDISSRVMAEIENDQYIADAEYFDGPSALKDIETPENHLFGEELKKVVQDAIKALPEDLRSALSLREFDGLSYEDIASVMDCPVGTVRSRIFRAREAVDMRIKAQIGGEEVEI